MDTADNLPDDAGYGSFDYDAYYAQQYEFRFCMTDEFYLQLKTEYARNTGVFWRYAAALLLLGLGALACLLHLLLVCGRGFELRLVFMAEDEPGRVSGPLLGKARLSPFWDKPWLDVLLGLTVLYAALAFFELDMLFSLYNIRETVGRFIAYCCILTAPFAALALWWLLSAAKRLKTRSFLKHTLIYTLLAFLFRPVRRLCRAALRLCRAAVNGLPLVWQIGVCSVVYGVIVLLLVAGFVHTPGWLLLFLPMLAVLVTFYFARKMSCLADVGKGIGRLARGDYDTPVPEDGKGLLLEMAKNVNAATDGLKAAVEKELVSQRFKAELITNVSHDLRTPLTSVITYAGLLQSEGLTSPGAPGYLDVIQSKARRLQTLTEDLFEASKASSGETRAELAPLDINQLIEQTLGEFGDRLETARLDVRVSGTCELAMADGRLLCRIFENLLRNIEKYAMPGTRVYIDKAGENGRAVITLRNISAEPLTGNAERLAERFTRGDEARSTEGSGLGLAIVRSLAELQKGTCAIASDGDLFKVTLTLPLA
jgi:signal transduction histidine kinase